MKLTKEQAQEIKDLQSQENKTKRVVAPQLEKILYDAISVLDHGFVRVIDYMGDDTSIVQAARVSYGKGTKKVSTDSGLINIDFNRAVGPAEGRVGTDTHFINFKMFMVNQLIKI